MLSLHSAPTARPRTPSLRTRFEAQQSRPRPERLCREIVTGKQYRQQGKSKNDNQRDEDRSPRKGSLGEHQRAHHVVVLVLEHVAVPHVLAAERRVEVDLSTQTHRAMPVAQMPNHRSGAQARAAANEHAPQCVWWRPADIAQRPAQQPPPHTVLSEGYDQQSTRDVNEAIHATDLRAAFVVGWLVHRVAAVAAAARRTQTETLRTSMIARDSRAVWATRGRVRLRSSLDGERRQRPVVEPLPLHHRKVTARRKTHRRRDSKRDRVRQTQWSRT